MLAQALRRKLAAWSISYKGRDDGIGFPEVKFALTGKNGQEWRYQAILNGEAAKAEALFDKEKRRLAPFPFRLRIIQARRVLRLGSRVSRGLPPKAKSRRAKRSGSRVACIRRYHQISVPTVERALA